MMMPRSSPDVLYVHVPFCRTICFYCDFCHTVYRKDAAERWLHALEQEIRMRGIAGAMRTIYIGGGTPTSLNCEQLETLLCLLDPFAEKVREYTVEINPETLDPKKAEILSRHGVNRVSMGFQASQQELLTRMNRHHTPQQVETAMELLRSCGITNISLDLMYSLPGQTMAMLQASVRDALALHPLHLSLYSLTIEENTVFGRKGYEHLDEDTEADMYEWICRELKNNGYRHYEISNFCREGYASMHNTAYWNYDDFIGLSCGASGKEGNVRYDNVRSLQQYLQNPLQREETFLTAEDCMFECVMMGLRLREGMKLQTFAERYGHTFSEVYGEKAGKLVRRGLLEITEDNVRCTDRGYAILNSILVELM